MNKTEARRIHAHFEASTRMSLFVPPSIFALALAMGASIGDAVAFLAVSLALMALMGAVSTDTMSRRIPNGLSAIALASGPIWWLSVLLGSSLPGLSGDGVIWTLLAPIYGLDGHGSVLPAMSGIEYPTRIALDLAMLGIFIPLYFSFVMGFGFGGGDVKLMTALAPFLGWPLGVDFFFLTFLIGGVFSVVVILGRKSSQYAIRLGWENDMTKEWSTLREFPFAPPIAIAAIICMSIKLQGLI